MTDAFIVGAYSTAFRRSPEPSFKDITREAYRGVLEDAQMPDALTLNSDGSATAM